MIHYITQNPAVQRNNRRIEYVNQLWNWYLLLMASLSMLDLVATKERWGVLQASQKLTIKEDQHAICIDLGQTYKDFANKTEQDPTAPDTIA